MKLQSVLETSMYYNLRVYEGKQRESLYENRVANFVSLSISE